MQWTDYTASVIHVNEYTVYFVLTDQRTMQTSPLSLRIDVCCVHRRIVPATENTDDSRK